MSNKYPNTNTKLPRRLCWGNQSNTHKQLPKSVWSACMGFMANIIKYLCQKCYQCNQCIIPNQSHQPNESHKCNESIYQHPCPNNPIRTCNCSNECADNANDNRNPIPNRHGWFSCPTDNKPCHISTCPNGCPQVRNKADSKHTEFP